MAGSGRDRAYTYLKEVYLADPECQGRFINEQEVADRIGVSRTPIREALFLLSAEGLVQLIPKRGAYVAPWTARELSELMELRGMVERHAATQAIARGVVPEAEMRAALDRQYGLRGSDEGAAFIDWDHRFHSALVTAVGNDMLIDFYSGLRARQVRAGIVALFSAPHRREAVLQEHEEILRGLVDGDVAAAHRAIDAHLDSTLRVLIDT
ncbi:GntR family transcriptional regulator [Marinactinospora thermotolerans]|uniref:Transcriptional regulator, GntR family n=1 Tax=Marinactinospora thermotolerans DSM 45154 TaxID=1122192 RepID=A0A1T4NNR4_9ACTN|nr:GntR family transcriptional regulator [Marinactinospora thermotolerans]SJZ80849.1 transcriptional regulator, GntR family [Marinactinospora thermotolerans DSM 45154]